MHGRVAKNIVWRHYARGLFIYSCSCYLNKVPEKVCHEILAWTTIFNIIIAGGDLLRLTKQDMIQIMGPADGIRLHNAFQAR